MPLITYRLVARGNNADQELLRSYHAVELQAWGAALSGSTAPGTDLLLTDVAGRKLASFDIWTGAWQAAA